MMLTVEIRHGKAPLAAAISFAQHFTQKTIWEKYDAPDNPFEKLPYHGATHSLRVAQDAFAALEQITKITSTANVEPKLGMCAGLFHDIVQSSGVPAWKLFSYSQRPRDENNEVRSAAYAKSWLSSQHIASGVNVFTEAELDVVAEAILATKVGLRDQMVVHSNLQANSSLVARVVAVTDVGRAGIHGWQAWRDDTIRLWLENDLTTLVARLDGRIPTSLEMAGIKERWLAHILASKSFVIDRQKLLEDELIAWLPKCAQESMRLFFGRCYPSVIAHAEWWYRHSAGLADDELLPSLGIK